MRALWKTDINAFKKKPIKKEAKVKTWHYPSYLLAPEYSTFDKKELSKFKKMTNYMSD